MNKLMLIVFVVGGFVIFSGDTVHATMRSVPSSYPTIQKAINAAQNGDEVVVAPGVYRENIEIVGKYITVRSLSDYNETTIAGNPGKTPVMIQNVPYRDGAKAQLSGFKITGGYSPDGQGGGITIANNADPIIASNKIENNQSLSQGGGILVYNNSNPLIRNNTIQNNSAHMFGGGIFVVKNSAPTISENYILSNTVSGASIQNGGSSGGGIYLENDTSNPGTVSKPIVMQNVISNNTAQFAGGGIMLRVGVSPIIENNTISNNQAPYGGGIHVETEGTQPIITNNTLTSNIAPFDGNFGGSGHGGGIAVYASSKPLITANTLDANRSSKGGAGIVVAENSSPDIQRNMIKNNSAVDSDADGGGFYIANASATLRNNVFDKNASAHVGGAVAIIGGSTVDISNNTIVNNQAAQTTGGGGIFISQSSGISATILNNIISANQKYQLFEEVSKARIENNIITNSGSGLYFNYSSNGITSASTLNSSNKVNAADNIDSGPAFTNSAASDYNLTSSSPAINLSQNIGNMEDTTLLMRPVGSGSDAGAYEYNDGSGVTKNIVYRFWSDTYRGHFYTINADERNGLVFQHQPSEWRYEGKAYYAFTSQVPGSIPLYRFWSNQFRGHFYTTSASERDYIQANYPTDTWNYEGVAYYVYPLDYSATSANVDRFWSTSYKHHFYTASSDESIYLRTNPSLSSIWSYEGGRFSVPR